MRLNVGLHDLAILLPIYVAMFVFRKNISVWLHKAVAPSLKTWDKIESGKPPSSSGLLKIYWFMLILVSTILGIWIAGALFNTVQIKDLSLDEYRRRWPRT